MKSVRDKLRNQNGFIQHQLRRSGAGFTLIELIVVIAILGVLAVVLITLIDPLDKINAGNDSGVISTIIQLGKANDTYAATNNNQYPSATTVPLVVTALSTAGEIKQSTITAPANYIYTYLGSTSNYAFTVNLRSKKNTTTPWYVYANGKGCTVPTSSIPVASTFIGC